MKKSKVFIGIFVPFLVWMGGMQFAFAHGAPQGTDPASRMMQQVEEETLNDSKRHEEMEKLMEKMMAGTLTEEETRTLSVFMRENPGAASVMMGRMMGMGRFGSLGMMPCGYGGGFGLWHIFAGFGFVVWVVVGVLLVLWLWRQLRRR